MSFIVYKHKDAMSLLPFRRENVLELELLFALLRVEEADFRNRHSLARLRLAGTCLIAAQFAF